MRILIAPDKFKNCLSAHQAAQSISRALHHQSFKLMPLADGGEGTARILSLALNGQPRRMLAGDPLGRSVSTAWIWFPKTRTALIELAQASSLWRLRAKERNPLHTSTYGTGQLIRGALALFPKEIWLALGGSATVDGGAGLLQALGARLLIKKKRVLLRPATGADLSYLQSLDLSLLDPRLARAKISILCDVDNPLLGSSGAARAFGPQKGASPRVVARLERGLRNWARILERATTRQVIRTPALGAAGGAAAGLFAALRAKVCSGAQAVMDASGFDAELKKADLVITGEGMVDRATWKGKVVGQVAQRAARAGIPVVILAGRLGSGWKPPRPRGRLHFEELARDLPPAESMAHARTLLPEATKRAFGRLPTR